MLQDSDQKQRRREDAIYNPIEGKWEKRENRTINHTVASKWVNKLNLEYIKTVVMGLGKDAGRPPSSTIRKAISTPLEKLKGSMHRQELHDQKVLKINEKEYQKAKKEDLMIVKIAIGLILLFLASRM